MAPLVESISPVPIADPHLPIALRRAVEFAPLRGSIFDDPGDEKSWRISQRAENLSRYYEDRDPSWYASAIAPLDGAHRVLDLGCGPGLALRALLERGCSTVLGVDRWPAFVADSTPDAPIIAHDLSLPMPFLESGSFDGVLSHYSLDYVSPICARQVLREAHRILAPGGRLALYLAAVGLSGGDESRTVCYSPQAVRVLLAEAGFEEVKVAASPNGRNTVAHARRLLAPRESATGPSASVEDDTQISVSFPKGADSLTFELAGRERAAVFSVDLPRSSQADNSQVSACARALWLKDGGTELQFWAWRGHQPLVAECARVSFCATRMHIDSAPNRDTGHVSVWSPAELPLEPQGSAYVRLAGIGSANELSEAERSAEGRQVVVECIADPPSGAWDRLAPGRNRFLIRQASRADLAALDRDWLSARLQGVAVMASELDGDRLRELLLWCGWRQSLLYLGGRDWESIRAVAERRCLEMTGPVVLVDPALADGGCVQPLSPDIATFTVEGDNRFALLDPRSMACSASEDLASVFGRLLLSCPSGDQSTTALDANETLRYLTERTLLLRLRQAREHSWAEVGRRSVGR